MTVVICYQNTFTLANDVTIKNDKKNNKNDSFHQSLNKVSKLAAIHLTFTWSFISPLHDHLPDNIPIPYRSYYTTVCTFSRARRNGICLKFNVLMKKLKSIIQKRLPDYAFVEFNVMDFTRNHGLSRHFLQYENIKLLWKIKIYSTYKDPYNIHTISILLIVKF